MEVYTVTIDNHIYCELFLSCTPSIISAAIQFSFETTAATGNETAAAELGGTQSISLLVVLNIQPNFTLLESDIVVSTTVTSGNATSKYYKYLVSQSASQILVSLLQNAEAASPRLTLAKYMKVTRADL